MFRICTCHSTAGSVLFTEGLLLTRYQACSSAMPMGHPGTVEGYSPNVTRLDTPISALSDDHPGDHSFVAATSQGEQC